MYLFRHFIVALAFACGRKLDLGDAYGERFSRDAHTKAEDVGDGFLECDARLVLVLSGDRDNIVAEPEPLRYHVWEARERNLQL